MVEAQAIRRENEVHVPRFPRCLIISEPSLVVDEDGVAWWVDPGANTIRLAKSMGS